MRAFLNHCQIAFWNVNPRNSIESEKKAHDNAGGEFFLTKKNPVMSTHMSIYRWTFNEELKLFCWLKVPSRSAFSIRLMFIYTVLSWLSLCVLLCVCHDVIWFCLISIHPSIPECGKDEITEGCAHCKRETSPFRQIIQNVQHTRNESFPRHSILLSPSSYFLLFLCVC